MKKERHKKIAPKEKITLEKPRPQDILPDDRTWAQYLEENSFGMYKHTKVFIPRLINTLYYWVSTDEPIHLGQFCMKYKISREMLNHLQNDYPDLKKALVDIKYLLAVNRFMGAVSGKYVERVVLRDLHQYDPDWNEVNKYWHAMNMEKILSRVENNQPTTLQVIMQQAPIIKENDEATGIDDTQRADLPRFDKES